MREHKPPKLEDWEAQWLMKEYELLTEHYFHEDDTYFKIIGLLLTVNGALIAFSATSDKIPQMPLAIIILFSTFGLSLALAWAVMLVRIRAYRLAHTDRIEAIEKVIESHWRAEVPAPQIRLHMETRIAAAPGSRVHRFARQIPSSVVFLVVPLTCALYWVALPFWRH